MIFFKHGRFGFDISPFIEMWDKEQLRKKREKRQSENALRHVRVHPFYPEKEGDPRRGNWRESQAKDTK